MDFQNLLTLASFVLYCTAQISQCILLRNNGLEKGNSEVSASMMQSCCCLGSSVHFLGINEVQYFEQFTGRGYFCQTLVFPVSKTIPTNWAPLERTPSRTHLSSYSEYFWELGSRVPFCSELFPAGREGALRTNSSHQAADEILERDGLETGRNADALGTSGSFTQDPSVPTWISQRLGIHQWFW